MIWGMFVAGAERKKILADVRKPDGAAVGATAIDDVIARKQREPSWRGEVDGAGGRPTLLTEVDKESILKVVFDYKAKAIVTRNFILRKLPHLRGRVSRWCIGRALKVAGLAWLARRRERWVPPKYKKQRVAYCKWINEQADSDLKRFAYSDGTTFYLAEDVDQHEDKRRAALGKYCWRMANGKDGLVDENIGPSMYAKAQGVPVKIWGLFANGRLEYYLLPSDNDPRVKAKAAAKAKARAKAVAKKKKKRKLGTTNMTIERYVEMVNSKFKDWRRACFGSSKRVHLIQDHERVLWNEKSLEAVDKAGFDVVTNFPTSSPDLNAIEGWWARLRDRLNETAPTSLEKRKDFVKRLRRTVTWMNENWQEDALQLCMNQQQRAADVLLLKGALSKW